MRLYQSWTGKIFFLILLHFFFFVLIKVIWRGKFYKLTTVEIFILYFLLCFFFFWNFCSSHSWRLWGRCWESVCMYFYSLGTRPTNFSEILPQLPRGLITHSVFSFIFDFLNFLLIISVYLFSLSFFCCLSVSVSLYFNNFATHNYYTSTGFTADTAELLYLFECKYAFIHHCM